MNFALFKVGREDPTTGQKEVPSCDIPTLLQLARDSCQSQTYENVQPNPATATGASGHCLPDLKGDNRKVGRGAPLGIRFPKGASFLFSLFLHPELLLQNLQELGALQAQMVQES